MGATDRMPIAGPARYGSRRRAPVRIEVETKWGLVIAHLLRARPAPAGDAKDSPARRP